MGRGVRESIGKEHREEGEERRLEEKREREKSEMGRSWADRILGPLCDEACEDAWEDAWEEAWEERREERGMSRRKEGKREEETAVRKGLYRTWRRSLRTQCGGRYARKPGIAWHRRQTAHRKQPWKETDGSDQSRGGLVA